MSYIYNIIKRLVHFPFLSVTHTHTQLKCTYFKHRQLTQLERKLMRSLKLI